MTPGLAMFYGGMNRHRGVLNMMMMSFGALGLVSVLWVLYGYSFAFGDSVGGLIGNPVQYLGLDGIIQADAELTEGYPTLAFVAFQAVFAIITVALISGAIADRAKFGSWMVFAGILFLLLGLFNIMWAIAAFAADDDFVVDELLFGDLTLWGFLFLIVAAAQLWAAWLIGIRNPWGRVLGIGLACLSATFAMLTFGARPLWAATVLALDLLAIYGLAVHGDKPA